MYNYTPLLGWAFYHKTGSEQASENKDKDEDEDENEEKDESEDAKTKTRPRTMGGSPFFTIKIFF